MPKESQNVDKRCTLSSLVSNYNHLYAMDDKSKTTHSCGFPTIQNGLSAAIFTTLKTYFALPLENYRRSHFCFIYMYLILCYFLV